ncbi:gliding motility lipoprotein GldB [Maribacter sp. 2308TA10-17]|uniref:gliding motility lipoprotein GldB n=1 Tax=Maribacter sp. 2308TA10-17 TaxID=3386276 RepID=UPI0039BC526D
MRRPIFIVLIMALVIFGCNDTDKIEAEIAKIPVKVDVSRFDREFAKAKSEDLPELKSTYPYLFPNQYPDSVWEAKLKDTIQIELFDEVGKSFPDFEEETQDLTALFQHIKYYYPEFKVPKVITLTSEVQYNSRVILADTLLLLGLDNYLGADHKFYVGIQEYISAELDRKFMISDVADNFARKVVPRLSDRTFLADMIYYGKILYIKDKLLPNADDVIKMGYSKDQLDWAAANEEPIWRNFIEQEHLYSTDLNLRQRFIDPAPFSKFGLELDNESPGRLGQYIGWQIVRAFMDKNEITLQQLVNISAEEIFKKANYKPRN